MRPNQNPVISRLLKDAPLYRKKAVTYLRLPHDGEIGGLLETFVKDGQGIRLESSARIGSDSIVARNAEPIGQIKGEATYNAWTIARDVAIENYGLKAIESLGAEFSAHQKVASQRMIKIDDAVFEALGVEGETLFIDVDWSDEPMAAKRGDYLAQGGYSISANDMADYVLVDERAGMDADRSSRKLPVP